MTVVSTTIRSAHLLSNAAWFGGSLMGAVGLRAASDEAGSAPERAQVADAGWSSWGPVQGAAIATHLASGVGILVDNRVRSLTHAPTRTAVVLKTAMTGLAVASSAAAWKQGERLGDALERNDQVEARRLRAQMSMLRWATPVTTGALLVLDAYLGEQQRGPAGLLDTPLGS